MIKHTDIEMKDLLKLHEGCKTRPYECTMGKLTIGVGRNLTDRGLHISEIEQLLENDIRLCIAEVELYFPYVGKLSKPRQMAIVDMCFNMGINRLRGFKRMLLAVAQGDFDKAADEMMDSNWAEQVGQRAKRLSEMMRNG